MLRRILGIAAASALAAVALTSCSSDSNDSGSTAGDGSSVAADSSSAFPVTIKNVFGETTIEKKPVRVATVAWANQEVPLALGIVRSGWPR